jgi:hypothetical protein
MDATIGTATPPPAAYRPSGGAPSRVTAPSQSSEAGERSSSSHDPASSRREVTDDPATGTMVFRLVDVATGDVTAQTPSEARLKLRAYIDQLSARTNQPSVERIV